MPRAGLEPAVIHSVPMAFSRLGVLIGVHRCKSMGLLTGDDGVGIIGGVIDLSFFHLRPF